MLARTDWPKDYQCLFWEHYPRKVSKKFALKSLDRIRKSGEVPFEVLLSAVQVYARSVGGKDMKYVAHPATWLNAGRWDDAPEALLDGKVQLTPDIQRNVDDHIRRLREQRAAELKREQQLEAERPASLEHLRARYPHLFKAKP